MEELKDYIEDAYYKLWTKRNRRENSHFNPPLKEDEEAQYILLCNLRDILHGKHVEPFMYKN